MANLWVDICDHGEKAAKEVCCYGVVVLVLKLHDVLSLLMALNEHDASLFDSYHYTKGVRLKGTTADYPG